MTDEMVISDRYRSPITARRRTDELGGVVLRDHRHALFLSESELDRLVAFVRDEPSKARLQRYTMAPKTGDE